MNLVEFAKSLSKAGIRHVPTFSDQDKKPIANVADFYERKMTEDECKKYYSKSKNIGIIGGKGYVGIDFDFKGFFWVPFAEIIKKYYPNIAKKIKYVEQSQNEGIHVIIKKEGPDPGCPDLACMRYVKPKPDKVDAHGNSYLHYLTKTNLIKEFKAVLEDDGWVAYPAAVEIKGNNGYLVIAPSPGYEVILGKIDCIDEILTEEEWQTVVSVLKSLDQKPKVVLKTKPINPVPKNNKDWVGIGTFEDYNARGDHVSLLISQGWEPLGSKGVWEHWRRPGKTTGGNSATWNTELRLFRNFSSSSFGLESHQAYNLSQLYTIWKHGGNFSASGKDLYAKDYGTRQIKADPYFEFLTPVNEGGEINYIYSSPSFEEVVKAIDKSPIKIFIEEDLNSVPDLPPEFALVDALLLAGLQLSSEGYVASISEHDFRFIYPNIYAVKLCKISSGKGLSEMALLEMCRLLNLIILDGKSEPAILKSMTPSNINMFGVDNDKDKRHEKIGRFGLFVVPEISRYIGKNDNIARGIINFLLEIFNSRIGKWKTEGQKPKTILVDPCAPSCIFSGQPSLFEESAQSSFLFSGFLARPIYAFPDSPDIRVAVKKQFNSSRVFEAYSKYKGKECQTVMIYPLENIKSRGDQFRPYMEEFEQGTWDKLRAEYLWKFCMMLRPDEKNISIETVQRGLVICDWLIGRALEVFKLVHHDPFEQRRVKFINLVRKYPGASTTFFSRKIDVNVMEMKSICDTAIMRGLVTKQEKNGGLVWFPVHGKKIVFNSGETLQETVLDASTRLNPCAVKDKEEVGITLIHTYDTYTKEKEMYGIYKTPNVVVDQSTQPNVQSTTCDKLDLAGVAKTVSCKVDQPSKCDKKQEDDWFGPDEPEVSKERELFD